MDLNKVPVVFQGLADVDMATSKTGHLWYVHALQLTFNWCADG